MSYAVFIILCLIISFVIGSFFGSLRFAFVFSKILKINILEKGSKNPGATNLARVSKVRYGILTAFLDMGKIILATYIFAIIFNLLLQQVDLSTTSDFRNSYALIYLTSFWGVLAHCFPVLNKFKNGGKGVAAFVGLCFCISPYLGLIFIVVWWIIFLVTKYPFWASILTPVAVIFLVWISALGFHNYYWFTDLTNTVVAADVSNTIALIANNPVERTKMNETFLVWSGVQFSLVFALTALIIYRHKTNIVKFKNKTEKKFDLIAKLKKKSQKEA